MGEDRWRRGYLGDAQDTAGGGAGGSDRSVLCGVRGRGLSGRLRLQRRPPGAVSASRFLAPGCERLVLPPDQLGRAYGLSQPLEQSVAQYCESCPEFLTGSEFLEKLRAGRLTVGKVRYTSILTRNDELVFPYTSGIALEPNMRNYLVQDVCPLDQADHVSLVADPVVAQMMLNRLDPQHAAMVPCTLVLPETGAPGYTGPPQ